MWTDGLPFESPGRPVPLTATATSHWTSKTRKKAAAKGHALRDGSYPIADKADWYKARQALGRAGKKRASVIRHLRKRARALGIPREEYAHLKAKA